MTQVALAGESGRITEIVEIGPTSLVRHRVWDNLRPLVEACERSGLAATPLAYGPLADDLASPDVWLLSDMPFLAAESSGLLARLVADVPARSGLLMIGGAFSFAGLKGLGGWADPRAAGLLPVVLGAGADDTEMPAGVRLVAAEGCPATLAAILSDAPPFFGYNRLQPCDDALVLARFEDGAAAIVASGPGRGRSVAVATDFLPHWGPAAASWHGLPDLLGELCRLAAVEPGPASAAASEAGAGGAA